MRPSEMKGQEMNTPQRIAMIRAVINEIIDESAILCETRELTTCEFRVNAQDYELTFAHNYQRIKLSIYPKNVMNPTPFVITINFRSMISDTKKVLVHFINLICFGKELSNA